MENDSARLPSVIHLTLDGDEFMALFGCALGFVVDHHPRATPEERRSAALDAVKAMDALVGGEMDKPDRWDDLILRGIRLADAAWPGRFTFVVESAS